MVTNRIFLNIVIIKIIIFSIFLALSTSCSYAQSDSPLNLAKRIFSTEPFPDIQNYVTGDYNGKPNGQDIEKGTNLKFLLLEQHENDAVIAMTIGNTSDDGGDWYLYFKRETIWKMCDIRSLAMTGMIYNLKIILKQMTPQEINKIIKNEEKDDYSMFHSKEEYDFLLGNYSLTLELDDNIVKHFKKNIKKFEQLKNLVINELKDNNRARFTNIQLVKNYEDYYHKLYITSISIGDFELDNCLNFLIGGIMDNTVGYIYMLDDGNPPPMKPSRIIMIRKIGNGWYMYKTT